MPAESPADFLRQNRERFKLVGYFLAIGGLSVPLAGLLRRGWYAGPGNVTRTSLTFLGEIGISLGAIQAVAFGFVTGLLALLVIDQKKRVQGLLLWIGLVIFGVGLIVLGSTPRLFRDPVTYSLGIGLGVVVAMVLVMPNGVTRSIARLERPTTLEFPRAPKLLWALTTFAIVAFWIESHALYPAVLRSVVTGESLNIVRSGITVTTEFLLVDSVAGLAFIGLTYRFMRYEATSSVMVIGPKRSGKTYTMYGAYLEWRDRKSSSSPDPMDPSQGMSRRIDEAQTIDQPLTDGGAGGANKNFVPWTLNSTKGGVEELSFTITEGDVFPMAKTVTTLDYTGEALTALAEVVTGTAPEDVSDARPDVAADLYEHVLAADSLVFLLDVERILDEGQQLDAAPYLDIIREYRDEKQLLFAATKADLLEDEYRERRQRDPYSVNNLDDFAAFVTEVLTDESGLLRDILDSGGATTLYPIYLMTAEYNGERYPIKTGDSLSPFGYVRLLGEVR